MIQIIFYFIDNTRDNTRVSTAPQLSSRMKHIKQEMAKNHLQFVRFEATDLHGVSRTKSIPAQFFQVSFTSSYDWMSFHSIHLQVNGPYYSF